MATNFQYSLLLCALILIIYLAALGLTLEIIWLLMGVKDEQDK